LQFVTGSNALKLIFNAELPTVVVQQHTPLHPYEHVLIPVLGHYADIQLPLQELIEIINIYKSKVTLLLAPARNASEEATLQQAAERVLDLLPAPVGAYICVNSPVGEKKFHKAVVAFAQAQDVSLIVALLNTKHHRAEAEKNKKFFQALITNEHGVPVLCL
jgi:hypothetical protein